MAHHPICAESDIPVGHMKSFTVKGKDLLVYHLKDGFYATQARCTHAFWPLEKGKLMDGNKIRCSFHHACFDVQTGEVVQWANFPPGVQLLNLIRKEKALKTYKVSAKNGKLFIDIR